MADRPGVSRGCPASGPSTSAPRFPGAAVSCTDTELALRYQSVFETATDGIIVITDDGTIESANAAVERLFGFNRDELVGANVSILMPEPYRSNHDGYIRAFLESGQSKIIGIGREVVGQRKDGSTFPLHLSVGQMEIGNRRMFTGFVHDLEPRRSLEEELARVEAKVGSLAQEAALRRVAMAVAREAPTGELMDLIADEVRRLLDADAGLVLTRSTSGTTVVGAAVDGRVRDFYEAAGPALDSRIMVLDQSELICLETHDEAVVRAWSRRTGMKVGVLAPVRVDNEIWGAVMAATRASHFAHGNSVRLLADFADLASLAIANSESRKQLRHLATTDSLTGLMNHRFFHETLARTFRDARGSGMELALVLLDIDWFKTINDQHGHQAGDEVLGQFAASLRAAARHGDTLARIGGEEFAWLMPGADARAAFTAADRFRADLAGRRIAPLDDPVSVSGGVCSLHQAATADELLRLADQALYAAKNHGRARCVVFGPDMPEESSRIALSRQLQSQQKLRGLRMLSRAIDARDNTLRWHSERVADVAVALAVALGWSPAACARLHEAGLVHDVGKIGVPDSVLLKPGPLLPDERRVMEAHVGIGVDLLADALDPEQIAWVAAHHERWGGGGYPEGLQGEAIPEGARLLALADSWDVMTSERVYKAARSHHDAAQECCTLAGSQFWPPAVDALIRLIHAGGIPGHGDHDARLLMDANGAAESDPGRRAVSTTVEN